jgi:ADP-ribosyl-[dinitrogen reductase] hydrolase
MKRNAISHCLLGGALGDALGLPAEGLNAKRIARLWRGVWGHRFVFGKGMVSDDTEHAVMTALSLIKQGSDPDAFAQDLARRLRWWFAGIPAGVGMATARSAIKLWCGVSHSRSGVWSAGNGPLMRAPVIGVHFANDSENRDKFTDASTQITHVDPRALESARLIAKAATLAADGIQDALVILDSLERQIESDEMKVRFPLLRSGLTSGIEVGAFADSFGRRPGFVSGFAPDTAAVALFAWLRHRGDYRTTVTSVIAAGGDTDTVAFVAGSLAGIDVGKDGMPADWVAGLRDWPLSGTRLSRSDAMDHFRYPNWPLSLVRNAYFLLIVLTHAFRRLLPPYQ